MPQHWPLQDTSNSGANVKRLDQESKDQMKEIESSIAAKKKEVGGNKLFFMVASTMRMLPVYFTSGPLPCHQCEHNLVCDVGNGQAARVCHQGGLQSWCFTHVKTKRMSWWWHCCIRRFSAFMIHSGYSISCHLHVQQPMLSTQSGV